MRKFIIFFSLLLIAFVLFAGFNYSGEVSAQNNKNKRYSAGVKPDGNADLVLADRISRLTDRRTDDLPEIKTADGGVGLDLGEGFQNVMLARLEDDGEPTAACVTSLGEADAFFGRDLQTGAAIQRTEFRRDPISTLAARHGMSKEEFEFYQNMIAQAAANRRNFTGNATVTIANADGAGEGLNDAAARTAEGGNTGATLGQQRLNVFNYAAGIWGAFLDTSVPVVINSQFNPLTPCSTGGGVLGSAGSAALYRDTASVPLANTWYPVALASKFSGTDINAAAAEINATFNSDIDSGCLGPGTRFYYGLDNSTPSGTVNLLIVLLHEFGHGFGFSSGVNGATGQLPGTANGRFPDAFTRFIYDRTTGKYWSQMTDVERVASAANSGNVFFDGANVKQAASFMTAGRDASTGRVLLYTPSAFQSGSSVSHWDISATPNLLMEPIINNGLPATLDLTRQTMRDIGWFRDTNADLVPDTITNVQVNNVTLAVNTSANVTWTNNGGFNRNVAIDLSTDGGATFPVSINPNVVNTGSYTFNVPNNISLQARIRVREADFIQPLGSSANFAIAAAAAAPVTITGRVFYNNGRPVSGKIILALQASGFATQFTIVNSFGYFRFDRVPAGNIYTISVLGKKYVFTPQTVSTNSGNISNLTLTAQP